MTPKAKRGGKVKAFKRHYSGDHSREFWNWVSTLPDTQRWPIYSIGCIIQAAEHQIDVICAELIRRAGRVKRT